MSSPRGRIHVRTVPRECPRGDRLGVVDLCWDSPRAGTRRYGRPSTRSCAGTSGECCCRFDCPMDDEEMRYELLALPDGKAGARRRELGTYRTYEAALRARDNDVLRQLDAAGGWYTTIDHVIV